MFIKIVGYLRLCLMPSFALGITWAIFPSSSHSAQLCTYESAQYLGNHPKEKEPGWHRDAQGLTHGEGPNDQYWYIAQESPDRIYRIPFGRNLAEDIECNDPGVKCVYLRDEPRLTDPGYNHFGDPDYFDPDPSDEEGGYIFMPVEGFASNATGAIAVYSTPNLEFLGVTEAHLSTDAPSDTPKRHMPWAAFDDAGYLYTSEAGSTIPDIDTPRKINRWRVAWNILDNPNDFRNFLFPAGQVELLWQLPPNYPYRLFCYPYNAGDSQCLGNNVFTLKDRDGNVPALPDSYIPLGLNVPQGGDISDDGRLLFILNGSSSNACVIAAVDENDGKTVLSTRDSCGISVFELSSVDQPGEACSIGEGDCRAVLVDRSRNKGGGGAFNFRYKPGGSAQ